MGPDLRAQAEDEPTVAVALQVVAQIGQQHGVAGEGHGDRRAQLDAFGVLGSHHVGQERVVAGLGRPCPGVARLLESAGRLANGTNAARVVESGESSVNLHGADGSGTLWWRYGPARPWNYC